MLAIVGAMIIKRGHTVNEIKNHHHRLMKRDSIRIKTVIELVTIAKRSQKRESLCQLSARRTLSKALL